MTGQTFGFRLVHGPKKVYDVDKLVKWASKTYHKQLVQVAGLEMAASTTTTDEPWGSAKFHDRAMKADLKYPLLLIQFPDYLRVADGMHRLYKHLILDAACVPAYVIPLKKLPVDALLYWVV